MTVKELMKELEKCDPDTRVCFFKDGFVEVCGVEDLREDFDCFAFEWEED